MAAPAAPSIAAIAQLKKATYWATCNAAAGANTIITAAAAQALLVAQTAPFTLTEAQIGLLRHEDLNAAAVLISLRMIRRDPANQEAVIWTLLSKALEWMDAADEHLEIEAQMEYAIAIASIQEHEELKKELKKGLVDEN